MIRPESPDPALVYTVLAIEAIVVIAMAVGMVKSYFRYRRRKNDKRKMDTNNR